VGRNSKRDSQVGLQESVNAQGGGSSTDERVLKKLDGTTIHIPLMREEETEVKEMSRMNRRDFLKMAAITGLSVGSVQTLLAGCGATPEPTEAPAATEAPEPTKAPEAAPSDDKVLYIQSWPGTYEDIYTEYVYKPFEEKTGIRVESTTTAEWYNVAKLKQEVDSGDPTLDLSTQLPGDVQRGGKDGLFEELNMDNIPNAKDLYDLPKTLLPYGVGYLAYTYGIGYVNKVDSAPTSWWDLWDPMYEGRVSVGKTSTTYFVQAINHALTGKMSPVDMDAVVEKLNDLTPNILKMFESDADVRNMVTNDEIDMWAFFNGRVAVMQDDGFEVSYLAPEEGPLGAFDYWCITKNSKRKEMAEEFINFALEPEPQKNIGLYLHYGPTNKTVTYDDPDIGKTMPYGAEAMDNLLLEDYEYVAENQDMWIERWNEWLVG
jgi:putative spermidine/putrescine transport system substrate-binding protein